MSFFDKIRHFIPYLRKPKYHSKYEYFVEQHPDLIISRNKQTGANIRTYYTALNNVWINACITVKTNEILNLGWNIRNIDTEINTLDSENIYVQNVFKRPFGYNSNITFEKLLSLICISHMGLGDAFVECITDNNDMLIGFQYIPVEYLMYDIETECFCLRNDQNVQFEDNQLIHIYNPPIDGDIWGVSPIDILATGILMETLSQNHTKGILEHGGLNPQNVILFDSDMDYADYEAEFKRLQEQAKREATRNSTLILKGADYKDIGYSPHDLEYEELQKDFRDRVLATFQVPPSKISIIETGNIGSGSGTSQAENFKKTLFSETTLIASEFNRILEEYGFDSEISFNELDIENKQERASIENLQLQSGVRTINEVRNGYNYEPVAWGYEPMILSNLVNINDTINKEKVDESMQQLQGKLAKSDYDYNDDDEQQ